LALDFRQVLGVRNLFYDDDISALYIRAMRSSRLFPDQRYGELYQKILAIPIGAWCLLQSDEFGTTSGQSDRSYKYAAERHLRT